MKNSVWLLSTHSQRAQGFTLVEMSVVLVIIGLIVGVVIEGTVMIHSAQLQSVVSDFTKLGTAYNQFKQLYGGNKPGDFDNTTTTNTPGATTFQKSTDIWGSAGGTGLVSDTNCNGGLVATSPATCDGDGNGYIAGPYISVPNPGTLTNPNEIYTAFQQLKNAKMLDGFYTGNPGTTAIAGTNVMQGQIENSAYMFLSQNPIVDNATYNNSPYYFYGNYGSLNVSGVMKVGTYIVMGSIYNTVTNQTTSSKLPENEVLSPVDAFSIDRKMDDGIPGTGIVMTYYSYPDIYPGWAGGNSSFCLTKASGLNGSPSSTMNMTYNTVITQPVCNLIYVNDINVN